MKLLQGDCLDLMKEIPNDSVDLILCDLPYGTIKGLALKSWGDSDTYWDVRINTDQLFKAYERILRQKGVIILFSQEPYTSHLRTHKQQNINFLYPLIWKKNIFGNGFNAKKAPLSYFEDISVFTKVYDTSKVHPLREYAAKVLDYIGLTKAQIRKDIGQGVAHFFYIDSTQFSLPTRKTYQALVDTYHIDEMPEYKTYDECLEINKKYTRVFNLPEGKGHISNVLEFRKDYSGYHPTQKPVALLEHLIRTYTNEGDTVLDNCMGSGSTGVACINTNRKFIGMEMDDRYYNIATQRMAAQSNENFFKVWVIFIKSPSLDFIYTQKAEVAE